jgi:hypothetical protein
MTIAYVATTQRRAATRRSASHLTEWGQASGDGQCKPIQEIAARDLGNHGSSPSPDTGAANILPPQSIA